MLSRAFITGRMCGVECFVRTTRVGGSGACGIFRRCRLRFGKRDLASSFFPCEFFNAPVALGLSSVDFWPVTSPLRRPIVVAFLIHWMTVGRRLYRGKRRWVSYQRMCFRVGVGCFFGLWARGGGGGGFPSSGCDFRVGVGCFSVRGPAPSFPWECFIVVATLGSSSVDFFQATSPPRRPNVVACTHRGVSVGRWTWFFQGQTGGGFPFGGCAYG
jgi:hypothetical protein